MDIATYRLNLVKSEKQLLVGRKQLLHEVTAGYEKAASESNNCWLGESSSSENKLSIERTQL